MIKQGTCASCMSKEISYDYFELDGEQGYFPYMCLNCGNNGKEWYKLEYIETTEN